MIAELEQMLNETPYKPDAVVTRFKVGDVVAAETDWNLSVATIHGTIVRRSSDDALCVRGAVEGNTDEVEREFPLSEVWNLHHLLGVHYSVDGRPCGCGGDADCPVNSQQNAVEGCEPPDSNSPR